MPALAAQPASYTAHNPHQRAASPCHETHAQQPAAAHNHAHGQCNICLDDMFDVAPDDPSLNANERYGVTRDGRHVRLECGHTYHKHCAVGQDGENGFLQHQTSCPTCRRKVSAPVLRRISNQLNLDLQPISAEERMNSTLRQDMQNGHQDRNSAENQMLWEAEVGQRATLPDELQHHNACHHDTSDLFTLLHGHGSAHPVRRRVQTQNLDIFGLLLASLLEAPALHQREVRPRRSQEHRHCRRAAEPAATPRRRYQRVSLPSRRMQSQPVVRYRAVQPEPFRIHPLFDDPFGLLRPISFHQPRVIASSFGSPFGFGFHQPPNIWFGDDMIFHRPHRIFLI